MSIHYRKTKTSSPQRVPLWLIGLAAGLAALLLLILFSYGAYTGLGSSL